MKPRLKVIYGKVLCPISYGAHALATSTYSYSTYVRVLIYQAQRSRALGGIAISRNASHHTKTGPFGVHYTAWLIAKR